MDRRARITFLFVVGLVALVAAGTAVVADDGKTPIPFSSPYATPYVITSPGAYVVTRQMSSTGAGSIIRVDCTNIGVIRRVDLDLNGFRLIGSGGAPVIEVIDPSRVCEVRIHNGATFGGSGGISAPTALSLTVEDLQIRDVTGTGIDASEVKMLTVRRAHLINDAVTGSIGIDADSPSTVIKTSAIIEDTVVFNTDRWGIVISDHKQSRVLRNHIEATGQTAGGGSGIECRPCWTAHIEANNITDNGGQGIQIGFDPGDPTRNSRSFQVVNNTLHNNGLAGAGQGITVRGSPAGGGLIANNTVDLQNNGNGINVIDMDGVVVRGNVCTLATGGYGIRFDGTTHIVVRDNLMAGNSGAGCTGIDLGGTDYCDNTSIASSIPVNTNVAGPAGF